MITNEPLAAASESSTAPADRNLAAPVRMIDPRMPVWRRIKDLDDLQAEAGHLACILDVTHGILNEMPYGTEDGATNRELDQVMSLVTVSQGLAEYLCGSVNVIYGKYRETTARVAQKEEIPRPRVS